MYQQVLNVYITFTVIGSLLGGLSETVGTSPRLPVRTQHAADKGMQTQLSTMFTG